MITDIARCMQRRLFGKGANDEVAGQFRDAVARTKTESTALRNKIITMRRNSPDPLRDLFENITRGDGR